MHLYFYTILNTRSKQFGVALVRCANLQREVVNSPKWLNTPGTLLLFSKPQKRTSYSASAERTLLDPSSTRMGRSLAGHQTGHSLVNRLRERQGRWKPAKVVTRHTKTPNRVLLRTIPFDNLSLWRGSTLFPSTPIYLPSLTTSCAVFLPHRTFNTLSDMHIPQIAVDDSEAVPPSCLPSHSTSPSASPSTRQLSPPRQVETMTGSRAT